MVDTKKIRLDDEVYEKLTKMKGKQSYSAYLDELYKKWIKQSKS